MIKLNRGVFMKKGFFLFGILSLCLLFVSCKNFLQGMDFLEELNNSIEYENAAFAQITLDCNSDAIKLMVPNVGPIEGKYKKGDSFDINFEETDVFQFIKWACDPEESVSFEPADNQKTTVKILNTENPILIYPVVVKRPVASVEPNGAVAVEKNTPIQITFDHSMNIDEETLSQIKIEIEGISVKENFDAAIVNDEKNSIIFYADENNLIPMDTPTKSVSVTIPQSFNFLEGEDKIYLKEDFVSVYKINTETRNKLSMTIEKTVPEWGTCSLVGDFELSVGQTQNIIFTNTSDYAFIEWIVKEGEEVVSPEVYSVVFDISNCNESEIAITAKKPASGYTITPLCYKRPKVVNTTPTYDSNGAYRDRRITIMFDQHLSENSIYYTKEELAALEPPVWDLSSGKLCDGYTLLGDINAGTCYGYQKTGDDNSIVWKCVSITKLYDENVNLLKHYKDPKFEDTNKALLIISTKKDVLAPPEGTEIIVNLKAVVGYSFVSTDNSSKMVNIRDTYSWSYFTNDKTDTVGPAIIVNLYKVEYDAATGIYSKGGERDYSFYLSNTISTTDLKKINIPYGKLWMEVIVTDEGSGPANFNVIATIPSDINKNIGSYYGNKSKNDKYDTFNAKTYDLVTYGSEGKCNAVLDLTQLGSEEMCSLTFKAYDINGNPTSYSFEGQEGLFFFDVAGPNAKKLFLNGKKTRTKQNEEIISWDTTYLKTNNSSQYYTDFDHFIIERYLGDTKLDDVTLTKVDSVNKTNYTFDASCASWVSGTQYTYYITAVDFCGNKSEKYKVGTLGISTEVTNPKAERTDLNTEKITWTLPTDYSDSVYKINIDRIYDGKVIESKQIESTETNYTFNFNPPETVGGRKFEYKISPIDYGNVTSTTGVTCQDDDCPITSSEVNQIKFETFASYSDILIKVKNVPSDFDAVRLDCGVNKNLDLRRNDNNVFEVSLKSDSGFLSSTGSLSLSNVYLLDFAGNNSVDLLYDLKQYAKTINTSVSFDNKIHTNYDSSSEFENGAFYYTINGKGYVSKNYYENEGFEGLVIKRIAGENNKQTNKFILLSPDYISSESDLLCFANISDVNSDAIITMYNDTNGNKYTGSQYYDYFSAEKYRQYFDETTYYGYLFEKNKSSNVKWYIPTCEDKPEDKGEDDFYNTIYTNSNIIYNAGELNIYHYKSIYDDIDRSFLTTSLSIWSSDSNSFYCVKVKSGTNSSETNFLTKKYRCCFIAQVELE